MLDTNLLIKKLELLTQDRKVIWQNLPEYLESNKNEPLRKYVIGATKYFYSNSINSKRPMLNEYNSFCSNIKNGTVALFKYSDDNGLNEYKLALQPSGSSLIETIQGYEEYQDELIKFYNVISSSTRNHEDYANEIINLDY